MHYWAFISYSHADEATARWLHRALETYRLPKKLVGTAPGGVSIPARLFPVFRDRDELPSSDSLGEKIDAALAAAQSLIVIATPRSAQSRWVNEEIRQFKALGKARQVFCLLADGEPHASEQGQPERESFARALRFQLDAEGRISDIPAEPIAADIRPGKDGRHDALLKLVAGILGLGLDTLKQRDQQRRQRRLIALTAGASTAAVVATSLSVLAFTARNEAQRQRAVAEARQQQAEGLIQFMVGDLRSRLEPIGKLDILDAVGAQALRYFGEVAPELLSDTELATRGEVLRQLGIIQLNQGRVLDAEAHFTQALAIAQTLSDRHPERLEYRFQLGESVAWLGFAAHRAGQLDRAESHHRRYVAIAEELVSQAPEDRRWKIEWSSALTNLGSVLEERGEILTAADHYRRAAEIVRGLLAASPSDPELLDQLRSILSWSSEAHRKLGDVDTALRQKMELKDLAQQLLDLEPEHRARQRDLILAANLLARLQLHQDDPAAALETLEPLRPMATALVAHDPGNKHWQRERFNLEHARLLAYRHQPSAEVAADLEALYLAAIELCEGAQADIRALWTLAMAVNELEFWNRRYPGRWDVPITDLYHRLQTLGAEAEALGKLPQRLPADLEAACDAGLRRGALSPDAAPCRPSADSLTVVQEVPSR